MLYEEDFDSKVSMKNAHLMNWFKRGNQFNLKKSHIKLVEHLSSKMQILKWLNYDFFHSYKQQSKGGCWWKFKFKWFEKSIIVQHYWSRRIDRLQIITLEWRIKFKIVVNLWQINGLEYFSFLNYISQIRIKY